MRSIVLYVDLVKFVEETVRFEHVSSPNKPIYLVGDSFGGCLALAVAARNPTIDLVLILANPGQLLDRDFWHLIKFPNNFMVELLVVHFLC